MTKSENKIQNYAFIDNIRGLSMMAIVMEHCSLFWGVNYEKTTDRIIQSLSLQSFKPGTIIFFILAGFLIGDKLTTYNTKEYLLRRTNSTIKPWLFWIGILLLLDFIKGSLSYMNNRNPTFFDAPLLDLLHEFQHIIFHTSFWFILNFLICILILLLFRKYIYSLAFGSVLFLLSLFYSINLYFAWIPTEHTTALFGFIFYLWLGVQLNKHHDAFNTWINKTKNYQLILLCLCLLIISVTEGMHLMNIGSDDPFNTLKISNIFFSLASFVLLYKNSNIPFIDKLKPRATTFGIYLVHQIIVFHLLPIIFRVGHLNIPSPSSLELLALQLFRFAVTYCLSYLVVSFLIKKAGKMKWIIGQ